LRQCVALVSRQIETSRRQTRASSTFDAIVFGYYEGKDLVYVARTRNAFTPATRLALFKKFKGLETQGARS
jgi:ATP-dependent DNA ligase